MQYPIVPYDRVMQMVNQTLADVLRRSESGKLMSNTPYAHAFCKLYFGRRTPLIDDLNTLVRNVYLNKEEKMIALDVAIRTRGQRAYYVDSGFIDQAFPWLKNAKQTRIAGRYDMQWKQQENVKTKQEARQQAVFEAELKQLLDLAPRDVPNWLGDAESRYSEFELRKALQQYWQTHDPNESGWSFHELYSEMTARQIALDLSWIGRD